LAANWPQSPQGTATRLAALACLLAATPAMRHYPRDYLDYAHLCSRIDALVAG